MWSQAALTTAVTGSQIPERVEWTDEPNKIVFTSEASAILQILFKIIAWYFSVRIEKPQKQPDFSLHDYKWWLKHPMFCVQCDQNNADKFAQVKGNNSQLYTALTGLIIHD